MGTHNASVVERDVGGIRVDHMSVFCVENYLFVFVLRVKRG